jgi:hypothetical protein
MFLVNNESRNKRYYSKNLWDKVINENSSRLSSGDCIGTVGHDQPIDDQAFLNGKISHKITKLWIDENGIGMGEIQVLATSAGKELNALLRGGIRIPVSSRASGEYRGTTSSGAKIIDENSFSLQGFDFVRLPGIPSAVPLLVESESSNENNLKDTYNMSQDLLESITRDKLKIQTSLEEALAKVSTLSSENSALRLAVDSTKKEVNNFVESNKSGSEKVTLLESELEKTKSLVSMYEALGTPREIDEALDSANKMISEYKKSGTTSEIDEALDSASKLISEYKEFGTVDELTSAFTRIEAVVEDMGKLGTSDEVNRVLETLETYVKFGTPTSISEQVQLLLEYEELGSPDQLTKILDIAEKYATLGTPEEINHAFELTESTVNKIKLEEKLNTAKKIASENEVELSIVESLLQKYNSEETIKLVKALRSNDPSNRYRREATNESHNITEVIVEDINEDNKFSKDTRGSRLMKMFSQ